MWKYCFRIRLSPSIEALKSGNFFNAATLALIRNASIVILTPAFSFSRFNRMRNASRSVMSASSNCVTWGIITQLRARLAPEIFRIRDRGRVCTGPNFVKSTAGHGNRLSAPPPAPAAVPVAAVPRRACLTKFWTSSCRMRPFGPVPAMRARSAPSSRANLRTDGDA